MGAIAQFARALVLVPPHCSLPVLCASVLAVSSDDVVSSPRDGSVSGVALFPGVDPFLLVDLLRPLVVSSNSFRSRRGTSS